MKHLPNELLYLLKVYNYITKEITLENARSRSEEIREYIANADYLGAFPTVKEYLSEEKSMEDIITYIQRNERTYSLLGDWANREASTLFSEKGISFDGAVGIIGSLSVKKEDNNAFFLLPSMPCIYNKIVLLNADISEDVLVENILWLEFYRTRECMCLEVFDDNCRTVKISFSDFEVKKVFSSAEVLSKDCKSAYEACVHMCCAINEKLDYDPSLLNEKEKGLIPVITFLSAVSNLKLCGEYREMDTLFTGYGISKAKKLLSAVARCNSDKKSVALSKRMARLLKSKTCAPLLEKISNDIILSQKGISAINELN